MNEYNQLQPQKYSEFKRIPPKHRGKLSIEIGEIKEGKIRAVEQDIDLLEAVLELDECG